jgi:hypothetical protein
MTDEPVHSEPPEDASASPEDETPPEEPTTPENKKKASPVRGFLDLLLILILAGLAGASYLLYEMQQKQRADIEFQLKKMEGQMAALASRKSAPIQDPATEHLKQELAQLREQYQNDAARQQEEITSLRQQLEERESGGASDTPPPTASSPSTKPHEEESAAPDTHHETDDENGAEDQYVDFVESFFSKMWRLLKEGLAELFDQIGKLIRGA